MVFIKKILGLIWGIITNPGSTFERIKAQRLYKESIFIFFISSVIISTLINIILQGQYVHKVLPSISTLGPFVNFILYLNIIFLSGSIVVLAYSLIINSIIWTLESKRKYLAIVACILASSSIIIITAPLWLLLCSLNYLGEIMASLTTQSYIIKLVIIIYHALYATRMLFFVFVAVIPLIWGIILRVVAIKKVYSTTVWKSILVYLISILLFMIFISGITLGISLTQILPTHPFSGVLKVLLFILTILIGNIAIVNIIKRYLRVALTITLSLVIIMGLGMFGFPIYKNIQALNCNTKGVDLRYEERYEEAILYHKNAIQICPYAPTPYYDLGKTYTKLKRYDKAIENYTKAIELNSNYLRAYNSRGNAYFDQHLDYKAIEDYAKAIELDPNYAVAYYNRANAYGNLKLYDKAFKDYAKAIELDPNYADAYYNRANAYDDLALYDKAIEGYTKVIELDPNYVKAYNNRGISYQSKELYNEALADYQKAIEIDPHHLNSYVGFGYVYRQLGDYDKAIVYLLEAKKIDPNDSLIYYNLGRCYESKNMHKEAVQEYKKFLILDSDNFDEIRSAKERIKKIEMNFLEK